MARPTKNIEEAKVTPKRKPANLTPDELAIYQRVSSAGQKREWETISEEDLHDYNLGKDPFKIPEFAQKLKDEKQYAFRWIERSRERIDNVNSLEPPFKWWLVTSETVPECEDSIDSNLGCVCLYDQMLVFKPYWMWEKERKIKEQIADRKDKDGSLEAKHHLPVDGTGSEFLADRRARIGGRDQVILHEGDIDESTGRIEFGQGDDGLESDIEQ